MRSHTIRTSTAALALLALLTSKPAAAGPMDFLRSIGDSIAHAHERQAARQKAAKRTASRSRPKDADSKEKEEQPNQTAANVSANVQKTPTPGVSPATPPVRPASGVSQTTGRDIPYGIPVPGKEGFVTSPWSPNQGYVDVRGFPSGTEVKDPYTGKVFLTP